MNKLTLMFAGLSVALALSVSLARPALAATDTRPTTSTTCPDKQTTTSSVPETTTSLPSTTSTEPETSSSTTATTEPTSTTSQPTTTVATTTTTVSGPTTTIFIGYIEWPYGPGPLTTATNPPVTEAPTTTTAPETTVPDDVELIPAVSISSPDRLPETGFAYGWVAGGGIFALLLGAYLLAVYRRWTA